MLNGWGKAWARLCVWVNEIVLIRASKLTFLESEGFFFGECGGSPGMKAFVNIFNSEGK